MDDRKDETMVVDSVDVSAVMWVDGLVGVSVDDWVVAMVVYTNVCGYRDSKEKVGYINMKCVCVSVT